MRGGSPTPFDLTVLRDAGGLTVGAVRRHPWILSAAVAVGLVASFAFWQILPRSYHTECQLLAQKNLVMPSLGNPRRTVPLESDLPTRGVADVVLSRENLISLIKHTGLLERWSTERAPLLQVKDWAWSRLRKPPTDTQRLEALVGILEKRLTVNNDDTSVTLAIDWPNARTAADLLQVVEDNFLAARHATEVSTIGETISILEGHAADVRAIIDSTFAQLESVPAGRSPGRSTPKTLPDSAVAADPLLEAEREAVHLRAIEKKELADVSVRSVARHPDADRSDDLAGPEPGSSDEVVPGREEARVAYPKARLKIALDNYDDLQRRIDAARIELDTAEAAFKYRYRVIQPVVVPQRPTSPHGLTILMTGALVGLLAGLSLAFGRDLRGEVVHAAWQMEQRFKIPVLVELHDE